MTTYTWIDESGTERLRGTIEPAPGGGALTAANIVLTEQASDTGSVVIPAGGWLHSIIAQIRSPFWNNSDVDLGVTGDLTKWWSAVDASTAGGAAGEHITVAVPPPPGAPSSTAASGWFEYPSGTTVTCTLTGDPTDATGVLVVTVFYVVPV